MKTKHYAVLFGLAAGLFVFLVFPLKSDARTPNFIDQSDSFISYSLRYEYTEGAFTPSDGSTTRDTDIAQSISMAQVSISPTYFTQFYGIVGLERNNLAGTSTERGAVTGGGGQFVLDYGHDLYLKAIGSVHLHEDLDVDGTNESVEITKDWQGGFLLGRFIESKERRLYGDAYHAYMGVLFSDRKAEITEGGTTEELELSDTNGGSVFAGLDWRYSRAVRVKFEGEIGAMSSGSLSLTYNF